MSHWVRVTAICALAALLALGVLAVRQAPSPAAIRSPLDTLLAALPNPWFGRSCTIRNDTKAVGALKGYGVAQAIYQRRTGLYAGHLLDLNEKMDILDAPMANATSPAYPYSGYYFVSPLPELSEYELKYKYALAAIPARYDLTGVLTLYTDQTGTIDQKDLGGALFTSLPKDPEAEGWTLLGK